MSGWEIVATVVLAVPVLLAAGWMLMEDAGAFLFAIFGTALVVAWAVLLALLVTGSLS